MDKYRKYNYKSIPQQNMRSMRDNNPSFSSTLLDQIYRSIDETNDHQVADVDVENKDKADFQRIENWMENKKRSERITKNHQKSAEKYGIFSNLNSSWSSSDSSSGGLFSSEAESNYGVSSRSSSTTTYNRPKPIKTSSTEILHHEERDHEAGGVVKRSKLKALKMYNDLKKVKQPISPGVKIASFLNSLFTTGGNVKKGKISEPDSITATPACSTSRSCLSKSPGKLSNNATKRSVRFYPISVIVDEDCQPCGHKSLQQGHKNRINEEVMYHIRRKDQSVEEAARELLKNYQRKVELQMELEDEDDDDDDASYASSDLFELENLDNGIDVLGNYMEELPVYETTYLDSNRAIANR